MNEARRINADQFSLDSMSGAKRSYLVTMGENPSCTCPHFSRRLSGTPAARCKHIRVVAAQLGWIEAAEKASRIADAELPALLAKYGEDPLLGGVLRCERERRRQAERENEARLELFR